MSRRRAGIHTGTASSKISLTFVETGLLVLTLSTLSMKHSNACFPAACYCPQHHRNPGADGGAGDRYDARPRAFEHREEIRQRSSGSGCFGILHRRVEHPGRDRRNRIGVGGDVEPAWLNYADALAALAGRRRHLVGGVQTRQTNRRAFWMWRLRAAEGTSPAVARLRGAGCDRVRFAGRKPAFSSMPPSVWAHRQPRAGSRLSDAIEKRIGEIVPRTLWWHGQNPARATGRTYSIACRACAAQGLAYTITSEGTISPIRFSMAS